MGQLPDAWLRHDRRTCHSQRAVVFGEGTLKVIVDHDRCEGNARCMMAAPEVFELRADDQAYVLIERPGVDLAPKVAEAVRLCPRQAITTVDE